MKYIKYYTLIVLVHLLGVIVGASTAGLEGQAPAQPAAAPADNSSTFTLNVTVPVWARSRSSDIKLDFSKADAPVLQQQQRQDQRVSFRGQALQVTHKQGYYHGNVAVARLGSQFVLAVRKIKFYMSLRSALPDYPKEADPSKKWVSWWVSRVSLCTADAATLQPLSCSDYDPRSWRDEECMWSAGFESLGPEDPRLIVWPGKGLFVIITSKPWPTRPGSTKPSDTRCAGPWAQQPWLAPLITYPQENSSSSSTTKTSSSDSSSNADPWTTSGLIRLQYLPEHAEQAAAGSSSSSSSSRGSFGSKLHNRTRHRLHTLHKEKNWNPFVYNNELYFSQSFDPHVVIKPAPNGTCTTAYTTASPLLQRLPAQPRGNTQAVLLPSAVSGEGADVYIGIVHVEVQRRYENYFYKMQAEPPFSITALSAPISLVYGAHPRIPAWGHIAFPMSLQLMEETRQLMIGYGSGDQVPRVKVMGLEEVLALFEQGRDSAAAAAAAAAGGVLD